jgi:hypothetical protein
MQDISTGFCSWCFKKGKHDLLESHLHTKNEYVCRNCKNIVVKCTYCNNMAMGRFTNNQVRLLEKNAGEKGRKWIETLSDNWKNECCALHDGTLPDFKVGTKKIDRLNLYSKTILIKSKHYNMVKVGTMTAGALTTAGVVALTIQTGGTAAPAIAATLGKWGFLGKAGTGAIIKGLSGAALTSASLAKIGGTVAAGTAIITAAGVGLGGYHGAIVAKKYAGEDKAFGIYNKRRGGTHKTVCINGFLQEQDVDFTDWIVGHREFFPDDGIYGLTWGSKDLFALGRTFGSGVTTEIAKQLFKRIGKTGSKKYNPFAPLITTLGFAGNPWHVSMVRAAKTGAVLADAISRCKEKSYTLVGHSLGCRVIYYALQALSSRDEIKVDDVILLGGAVGKDDLVGWKTATKTIKGKIYNCYSKHDAILSKLYRIANANLTHPIGISPIPGKNTKIKNINCNAFIKGATAHMNWKKHYIKVLSRIYN